VNREEKRNKRVRETRNENGYQNLSSTRKNKRKKIPVGVGRWGGEEMIKKLDQKKRKLQKKNTTSEKDLNRQ